MRKSVTDEEFIRAWLTPGLTRDVAKTLGLTLTYVRFRAWQLRKAGVKLPKRAAGQPKKLGPDVPGLNRLIRDAKVSG